MSPPEIGQALCDLRDARRHLMADGASQNWLQGRVVEALVQVAALWRAPNFTMRRQAAQENAGFPFPAVWQSLEALLESFSTESLWALIDSEKARGLCGPDVIGHVIASNTPLLAWTSIARALLVQSASFVKLPSHPVATWAQYFKESLVCVDPDLAQLIYLARWKGGEEVADRALWEGADFLVAYGDDQTMNSLRRLLPASTPFVEYGHKISFGLVCRGADLEEASRGLASDILLYDQGGCLSPQCVLVEGDIEDALLFAGKLARALESACREGGFIDRSLPGNAARAAAVRKERSLARMRPDGRIWECPSLYWTVVALPECRFLASSAQGMVYIAPFVGKNLKQAIEPVRTALQGASVAAGSCARFEAERALLSELGVSYICKPGQLQRPPLSWLQNGFDVLRLFGR